MTKFVLKLNNQKLHMEIFPFYFLYFSSNEKVCAKWGTLKPCHIFLIEGKTHNLTGHGETFPTIVIAVLKVTKNPDSN